MRQLSVTAHGSWFYPDHFGEIPESAEVWMAKLEAEKLAKEKQEKRK
jgi:hypothetical protein